MIIPWGLTVSLWALLVPSLSYATNSAWPLTREQVADDLRSQLSVASEIVSSSETSYITDFTPRFNVAAPPTYTIAVKPALVTDVQRVVGLIPG